METLLELDGKILLWIQDNIRNPILDPVMKCFTRLGNGGLVWIAIIVLMLAFKKTRHTGIVSLSAMLVNLVIINLIIKNVVARTRPYEVIDGLNLIVGKAVDYSFPSGHAGHSFAAAVVIFALMPRKYGIGALILATMISFSRLYVGIHYPSDVIAGMVIGALVAIATLFVFKRMDKKRLNNNGNI